MIVHDVPMNLGRSFIDLPMHQATKKVCTNLPKEMGVLKHVTQDGTALYNIKVPTELVSYLIDGFLS